MTSSLDACRCAEFSTCCYHGDKSGVKFVELEEVYFELGIYLALKILQYL